MNTQRGLEPTPSMKRGVEEKEIRRARILSLLQRHVVSATDKTFYEVDDSSSRRCLSTTFLDPPAMWCSVALSYLPILPGHFEGIGSMLRCIELRRHRPGVVHVFKLLRLVLKRLSHREPSLAIEGSYIRYASIR